jgi:endonuclease/exonuclease/phosphatase family metal-dependent hydrolase
MTVKPPVVLLCAAALLGACGGEGRKPEAGSNISNSSTSAAPRAGGSELGSAGPARPAKKEFRVATYNAGLAVGVLKYADERAEPLVNALAEQPVDLLCVQEFWLEDHWRRLASTMSSALPNTFRLAAEEKGGTCDEAEVAPLVECAMASCSGAKGQEIATCLLGSCTSALTRLSAGCFQCLAANPRGKPDAIARACVSPNGVRNGSAPSPKGAPSVKSAGSRASGRGGTEQFRVYSGSYGTGILTNAEILERDVRILPSALDRRAALYTRLATPIGELNAFCTHLTANIASVPHPARSSWRRDQAAQIDALLAFVEEKARDRPTLLLGDLNTGPAIAPHIAPTLPDHYARFVERGFLNPYASQRDVQCTYCFDNPLEGGRGTRGLLIDHVMLRNFSGQIRAGEQIMRPPVVVEPAGKPVRIGPSDHYGVSVTLSSGAS